jgi:hypothetical protein
MGLIYLPHKGSVPFEFAYLENNQRLIIRQSPFICEEGVDNLISLKKGSYIIKDSVLYIRGTRIGWLYIIDYLHSYDGWGCGSFYYPRKSIMDQLENPPEVKSFKKGIFKKTKNLIKFTENMPRWYKTKKEELFEIAISAFVLDESKLK